MTSRAHRIVLSAAVLPLVLLVGLRSAWAAYLCQMDREVRTSCCCPAPSNEERRPLGDGARVEAASCCDLLVGDSPSAPDVRETERLDDRAFALAARAPVVLVGGDRVVSTVRSPITAARPPPPDLPLYLVHRTILR